MSQNTDKENMNSNTDKRDLGKISYMPFNLLDKKVDFPVEQDIALVSKSYDRTAKSRRALARDLMGHDEYDKLSRKNKILALDGRYKFDPEIVEKIQDELWTARSKIQKEKEEREDRERKHHEYNMKKLKQKQEQEELNRLWLDENPETLQEHNFTAVDTPRPKPSLETNTPKSKELLRKTKSISNFGSFFNLGGKKSSKKNIRHNRYKKQSKRY
jgi:hypothetical protein